MEILTNEQIHELVRRPSDQAGSDAVRVYGLKKYGYFEKVDLEFEGGIKADFDGDRVLVFYNPTNNAAIITESLREDGNILNPFHHLLPAGDITKASFKLYRPRRKANLF